MEVQTIKLEDTTVRPKADVCGKSGFRIFKSPPIDSSSNYAHLRFDLEGLHKSQSLQSPVLWLI